MMRTADISGGLINFVARHMMSQFTMALLQYVYRWNGVDAAMMC